MLVVFGGFWLSVPGRHPYTGHIGGWAVEVAVVLVAVNVGWTAWVIGHAGTGVSGPAQRKWQTWIAIMTGAWIIGYAIAAPLARQGQPSGLGTVPGQRAAADHRPGRRRRRRGRRPVLAAGRHLPGHRRGGRRCRVRRPAGSWLITGVGLCAVYLGIATFTAWRQRRGMVGS